MATYNGAKWIEIQMASILSQIGPDDELVVVDDTSSDNTLELVRGFNDSRIRIFQNQQNLGVDGTFERALSLARGDILFLSDQDDVWYPDKVASVMSAFEGNPDVTLVLSDADFIDANGDRNGVTYFADRGAFIPGVVANIVKSKFLGCSMAMRRSILNQFLPFPEHIPGHDMWIGVINEFYGKSHFISKPLFGYRRHGENLSPATRQGLAQMLVWRWQLISGLAKRSIQLYADQ